MEIVVKDKQILKETGVLAARQLFIASALSLTVAAILYLQKFRNKFVYLIVLLAAGEMFIFARALRPTFEMELAELPVLKEFIDAHPGDYRILMDLYHHNIGMTLGSKDIWGYDPGVSRRYAEFMTFTQGKDPNQATQRLDFHIQNPLFAILRCRYVLVSEGDKVRIDEIENPLNNLELIGKYNVISERDRIFAAMAEPEFDPRKVVILESSPGIGLTGEKPKGTCYITDYSTDHMTIKADLEDPAILLITDSYSRHWKARALAQNTQVDYRVMPADYTLMAIPLSAGQHHFRLEYLPPAFQIGKYISIVSVAVYLILLIWYYRFRPEVHESRDKNSRM